MLKMNGFELFTRPFELNIVGIRSDSVKPNRFDDEIHVFYKTNKTNWEYHIFKVTTDPGTYWLKNPMQEQGTAILAQGQYKDTYQLGLHRGQYLALVQRKPVTIIRDYDRNAILDFNNGTKTRGMYGINIHRAGQNGKTKFVDKYSAGCQVFENAQDFLKFLQLCEKHKSIYGNAFTYSLLDNRALKRSKRRLASYVVAGIGVAGISTLAVLYYKTKKKGGVTE